MKNRKKNISKKEQLRRKGQGKGEQERGAGDVLAPNLYVTVCFPLLNGMLERYIVASPDHGAASSLTIPFPSNLHIYTHRSSAHLRQQLRRVTATRTTRSVSDVVLSQRMRYVVKRVPVLNCQDHKLDVHHFHTSNSSSTCANPTLAATGDRTG